MKNSYYLTVDVTSNKKVNEGQLDQIIESIETESRDSDLIGTILDNITLNFQSYIFISIEDEEFLANYSDQIEEICDLLERFIPGGCTVDSRIEWGSDIEEYNLLWFKNKDSWEFSEIENELKRFGSEDWNEDYDDQEDRDSYW